jgi:tRNA1Val (adenine37-N6)-methyltransferase
MSNQYFQFKQFKVAQDRCAMKVSTDACIQGAWTPIDNEAKSALDIGTGTGLLSLMLAQRNGNLIIDAVELDKAAAEQAKENAAVSPWAERINILQGDVKEYSFAQRYDMVICNPPFFYNSLLSENILRNTARHTVTLSYNDLFISLDRVVSANGYASIMLPVTEHEAWGYILKQNRWHIHRRLFVQPKETALPNRVISVCGRTLPEEVIDEKLVIYKEQNEYTPEATELLSPFYLKL